MRPVRAFERIRRVTRSTRAIRTASTSAGVLDGLTEADCAPTERRRLPRTLATAGRAGLAALAAALVWNPLARVAADPAWLAPAGAAAAV